MREIPILFSTEMVQAILEGRKTQTRRVVKKVPPTLNLYDIQNHSKDYILSQCPYGIVGDVLWVRETWCHSNHPLHQYMFQASVEKESGLKLKWKPSIFMPKDAARIWLEITDIRVERLQDISGEDALAEGVKVEPRLSNLPKQIMATIEFEKLWKSINGPESWGENPWVWVVSFKRK